jgi:hypothetical protein
MSIGERIFPLRNACTEEDAGARWRRHQGVLTLQILKSIINTARVEISDPKNLHALLVWDEKPSGDGPGGTADCATRVKRLAGRRSSSRRNCEAVKSDVLADWRFGRGDS